jgi:UDP-N-acetyl-D-glucosamine dehydrogenase
VPLSKEMLESVDCVLILTDHSDVDYQRVVESGQLIVDTRNATRSVNADKSRVSRL